MRLLAPALNTICCKISLGYKSNDNVFLQHVMSICEMVSYNDKTVLEWC